MTPYEHACAHLLAHPKTWLVTGVAGFIGSHLLQKLLELGQCVTGIDDLSTGNSENLEDVHSRVSPADWQRFRFLQGDVTNMAICREASRGADAVLHQAGFISVPLSMEDPIACHATNVTGTLNLLVAARDHGVKRFVYASSSAVYGDEEQLPQVESRIGNALSPYAASKRMSEIYAALFERQYGLNCIGLRYFNVFGPRQNPAGGYAAVIPLWISTLLRGEPCRVNGDGAQTRDFCHVHNVVEANILAAAAPAVKNEVYNVALGKRTSLNELHAMIASKLAAQRPSLRLAPPIYGAARPGDIRHSGADICKIRRDLGFTGSVTTEAGLDETIRWYLEQ